MIILPQAAPLGAAAAAAELTRLFPGRKLPEVAIWPSLRGNFHVLSFVRLFLPNSQGLGLNLRLSARTCVRSSQSSTKWVESTLCQDPSTWATRTLLSFITYYVLVIIMCPFLTDTFIRIIQLIVTLLCQSYFGDM